MEFSLILATAADSWKVAQRAESLGFDAIWFEDSQMVAADPFVAMAAAAMQTRRIRLGTGVCIPSNRIPPVTANMLATLNALAPGRIDWGVGTGFSARRAMGLPALGVRTLERNIETVQGLLAGETVECTFGSTTRPIRFLNPERDLVNTRDPIPCHVAANGPRARDVAARTGSHWIAIYANDGQAAADLTAMDAAYRAAGRNPGEYRKTIFTFGALVRDGETYDSPRVRAQAGPTSAMVLHNLMETQYGDLGTGGIGDEQLLAAYRALYAAYTPADARYLTLHRGHALFLREDEAPLIDGEFIRQVSCSGTLDELVARVRALRDLGYTGVSFLVLPHLTDSLDDWARVKERVESG
ncbi:MAG: LLM class flavin-dependent oxidoreductase [Gammaproteobacteria bacterium]